MKQQLDKLSYYFHDWLICTKNMTSEEYIALTSEQFIELKKEFLIAFKSATVYKV